MHLRGGAGGWRAGERCSLDNCSTVHKFVYWRPIQAQGAGKEVHAGLQALGIFKKMMLLLGPVMSDRASTDPSACGLGTPGAKTIEMLAQHITLNEEASVGTRPATARQCELEPTPGEIGAHAEAAQWTKEDGTHRKEMLMRRAIAYMVLKLQVM